VFKDVGLVEQLGSGMSRILKAYDKSAFEILPNFIKITFHYKNKVSNDTLNDTLNKSQISILNLIMKCPKITTKEISAKTNLSDSTIKRHLVALQNLNIISRVGSKKTGYWKIN